MQHVQMKNSQSSFAKMMAAAKVNLGIVCKS